jgi:uncharacterized SAM-binding protein YcdF (DUF218 family)
VTVFSFSFLFFRFPLPDEGTPLKIGLLTNAYHMPRALAAFSVLEDDDRCRVLPIC